MQCQKKYSYRNSIQVRVGEKEAAKPRNREAIKKQPANRGKGCKKILYV
jgi:hypothetical protein